MRYIMYAVSTITTTITTTTTTIITITLCVLKSMKMLDSLVPSDKVLPHERYSNYTVSFLNRSCTETVYDSAWSVSKVGELNRRHCVLRCSCSNHQGEPPLRERPHIRVWICACAPVFCFTFVFAILSFYIAIAVLLMFFNELMPGGKS